MINLRDVNGFDEFDSSKHEYEKVVNLNLQTDEAIIHLFTLLLVCMNTSNTINKKKDKSFTLKYNEYSGKMMFRWGLKMKEVEND